VCWLSWLLLAFFIAQRTRNPMQFDAFSVIRSLMVGSRLTFLNHTIICY